MSSNATTVKAIITNLKTILGTTLAYNLDYDISSDADVNTTPAVHILYGGETFEENNNEKQKYNNIAFTISLFFAASTPDNRREKAVEYIHAIRDKMTPDELNIGDLSASQLVNNVDCEEATNDNEIPVQTITLGVTVKYRET